MTAPALTVSRIKPHQDQLRWVHVDHAIATPAATRNLVGGFFEEASRILFNATPHITDATADICPDLSIGPRRYLEVKSVGRGRQGLIYAHRLARDRALVKSGASLTYVFWIHDVPAADYLSLDALRSALAAGVDRVLVIPFARLSAACRRLVPRVMNYRAATSDGHPKREMPGYRLSWRLLTNLAAGKAVVEREATNVYGLDVPAFLHGPAVAEVLPPLTGDQRDMARDLLADLRHHRLDVIKAPAPRPAYSGHCIRAVRDVNPSWYQALCRQLDKRRRRPRRRCKHDTDIRRPFVERALERLAAGECRYPYDWLLRPIVEEEAEIYQREQDHIAASIHKRKIA